MKLTDLSANAGLELQFEGREMLGSAPFMANLLLKVELGQKHSTPLFFTAYETGALQLLLHHHLRELDRANNPPPPAVPAPAKASHWRDPS